MGTTTLTQKFVAGRFLLTFGNFVVTLLAFFHRDRNVRAGLASDASQDDIDAAYASLTAALVMSFISVFLAITGLLGGFSMFSMRVTYVQLFVQFVSGVTTSLFVIDAWHYLAYWYIFALLNLPALLAEAAVLCGVFVTRSVPYSKDM